VDEARDLVPRDMADQRDSDADEVHRASPQLSCAASMTDDIAETQSDTVESHQQQQQQARPLLFEDISDAEDEPVQSAAQRPTAADLSSSSSTSSQSLAGSASTTSYVGEQSCSRPVPDDCSISPSPAAAACQLLPAAAATSPEMPCAVYPELTSPPPPPLDDMVTGPIVPLPSSVMSPPTMDRGDGFDGSTQWREVVGAGGEVSASTAEVADTAGQLADDVMDTSDVASWLTSDVNVTDHPALPSTPTSVDDAAADGRPSPSPPKIPRLRIVMGAPTGDPGQSSTSTGGIAASLPYVVTVSDEALTSVTAADQPELATTSPQQHYVTTDDVTESSSSTSSLAESASKQRRKVKHNKVRADKAYI